MAKQVRGDVRAVQVVVVQNPQPGSAVAFSPTYVASGTVQPRPNSMTYQVFESVNGGDSQPTGPAQNIDLGTLVPTGTPNQFSWTVTLTSTDCPDTGPAFEYTLIVTAVFNVSKSGSTYFTRSS